MAKKLPVAALALLLMASYSLAQTVIDGPIFSPINGHYYEILSNSDWTDAESAAQNLGGNLATVRSVEEQNWIDQTFSQYPFLWIGLYDPTQGDYGSKHASDFKWVDGEPITYTDWAGGEPNDFDGSEYWTQIILTHSSTDPYGTWNDVENSADPEDYPNYYGPDYGLVEITTPEPASLGAIAVAGGCLLLRRKATRFKSRRR